MTKAPRGLRRALSPGRNRLPGSTVRGESAGRQETMPSVERPGFEASLSCVWGGKGNETAFLAGERLQRVRSVAGSVEMENAGDPRGGKHKGKLAIAGAVPGATQGFNQ